MINFAAKIQNVLMVGVCISVSMTSVKNVSALEPITKNGEQHWVIPNLKLEKQKQLNWCWAATTRAALSQKLGSAVPEQCEIVSKTIGKNCCQKTPALGCNVPKKMEPVFAKMNFAFKSRDAINQTDWKTPDYSGFMATSEAIKNGKVVIVAYEYSGQDFGSGGAHVVVAYGTYKKKDGTTMVVTYDPLSGKNKHLSKKDIYGNMRWYKLYIAE